MENVFRAEDNIASEAAASSPQHDGRYHAGFISLNVCFQQISAMTEFIQNSGVLNSPDMQNFAACLVTNKLPSLLTVDPQSFSHNGALIEMAVHTSAVLLCGQNPILQPLRNLAFSPDTMEVKRFNSR